VNDHHFDDDDAQLYALGYTDPDQGAAIEAHLAVCSACRAKVVAAESAAAALAAALLPAPAEAQVQATSPVRTRRLSRMLATAAAVAFAATAGFEGYAAHTAQAQIARDDGALVAIATSHFAHTTLTSEPGVVVKALYAHDGSWCYVVATGTGRGAHVVMHRNGSARDLGVLRGNHAATLFVSGAGRVDEVSVVDDGRVVAHGAPTY